MVVTTDLVGLCFVIERRAGLARRGASGQEEWVSEVAAGLAQQVRFCSCGCLGWVKRMRRSGVGNMRWISRCLLVR